MNCQNTPPSQRGFTALELIIVLIIGFSIIGLSAGKMVGMMDESKATRALDSILSLSTAIKSLSNPEGYGTAGTDITANLVNADVVPKSLKPNVSGTDTTLTNQWNGGVKVEVGTDVQQFTITYPNVPKSACNKLVKSLLSDFAVSIASQGGAPTAVSKTANTSDISAACDVTTPVSLVLTNGL